VADQVEGLRAEPVGHGDHVGDQLGASGWRPSGERVKANPRAGSCSGLPVVGSGWALGQTTSRVAPSCYRTRANDPDRMLDARGGLAMLRVTKASGNHFATQALIAGTTGRV
jgi:hypothetical protein